MDYKDLFIIPSEPTADWLIELKTKWTELENKHNIRFFLEDDTPRPVTEWLDDLYLRFTPEQIHSLVTDIMNNGDILFANILKHRA